VFDASKPIVIHTSYFAVMAGLLVLTACSSSPTSNHQKLQTEFRASISLASESDIFLRHLDGHNYSSHFVQGHLSYLRKQGSEIQNQLADISVDNRDVESLNLLKQTTEDLMKTLKDMQSMDAQVQIEEDRLQSITKHLKDGMPR
jgi:hypothetical protein